MTRVAAENPAVRVVLNPCDNSEQCSGRPVQLIVPLMGGEYATRLTPDEARLLALELWRLVRVADTAQERMS